MESSGFREYGDEGKKLEEKVIQVAERWGIRFVGQNCIGVINMENELCTPFTPLKRIVRQGDISMVSQSGGVGMSVLNLMANEGLGFNKFVSAGNMLNIQTEEFLNYLIEDPDKKYIFRLFAKVSMNVKQNGFLISSGESVLYRFPQRIGTDFARGISRK